MNQKERRNQSIATLEKIVIDCAAYECEKRINELQERCSALESLLAELSVEFISEIGNYWDRSKSTVSYHNELLGRVDVILPKSPTLNTDN